MKILDFNDEAAKTNTNGYFVLRLYAAVMAAGETIYKLPSESLKELFIRLQRGNAFTQFRI